MLRPPPQALRDVIVEIGATLAHDVAQYLERNCPLPGAQEICALLKTIATTASVVVYPRDTHVLSEWGDGEGNRHDSPSLVRRAYLERLDKLRSRSRHLGWGVQDELNDLWYAANLDEHQSE